MCDARTAQRHSGYVVGGTSPFATRERMPVFVERSVLGIDRIYVNGGARGLLLEISPAALERVLAPKMVDVAVPNA